MYVAKEVYLGMEAEEREVYLDELSDYASVDCVEPRQLSHRLARSWIMEKKSAFPSGMDDMGPVTKKLYDTLTGIQMGRIEAPEGWIHRVC